MGTPLRVLIVEDSEDDALLVLRELRRGGYEPVFRRVETPEAMAAELERETWDIVISDYVLPRFTGLEALNLMLKKGLELPFIVTSGKADEETLVKAMKAGVNDYIMKNNLSRLVPAVERELRKAAVRRERKKAEEALRENEELYRSLFENMLNGFAYCKMLFHQNQPQDFIYLNVNNSFEALTGLKNVIGKKVSEVIPGIRESDPKLFEICGRVALSGRPERFEIYVDALGAWFWISVYSPRKEYFVAVFDVITERKKGGEALRESEWAAQRLAEENAVMAEIGRIIRSTLNIEEVYERFAAESRKLIPFDRIAVSLNNPEEDTATVAYASGVEIEGKCVGDVFALSHTVNEQVMRTRAGLILQPEALEELEGRFPTLIPTFRAGLQSMMSVPLISRDQVIGTLQFRPKKIKAYTDRDLKLAERIGAQIAGAVANAKLFGERKQAEESIKKGKEFYETVINSMKDALSIIDVKDLKIVDINKGFLDRWGMKKEEVIGKRCYEITHKFSGPCDSPEHVCPIMGTLKTGIPSVAEHVHFEKEGTKRHVEVSASPIRNERGEIIQVVHVDKDITERKNLESQLVQAQKLESIGQLAAGIAHEINTPTQYVGDNTRFSNEAFNDLLRLMGKYDQLFQTIKNGSPLDGVLQEIERIAKEIDLAYLTDEIPKAIRQTLEGVERVRIIVQAMKEFSHPGTKEKTPINLNKAIQNTITIALNEWKYVAEMATEFDSSLPLVSGLPGELNQVILNMIINAAHAIADVVGDGAKGKGTITVSTCHDGNWAEIRVSDTGTGIPENIRSRIFDPFFTTKKVGKGTGQGLTISHSVIVDKHGGTIHFDTEMGKGTTFIIRLPLEDGAGL